MEDARENSFRSRLYAHLPVSILATLVVAVGFQFRLDTLKGVLVDAQFRSRFWGRAHPKLALVGFTDRDALRTGDSRSLPPEELKRVMEALEGAHPFSVIVLGAINARNYSEGELKEVTEGLSRLPNGYIGFTDDESLGHSVPQGLSLPGRYLPGFVSRDTFSYGADSVSRRVMLSVEGFPTVYATVACLRRGTNRADGSCPPPGRHERLGDSYQTYINWRGPAGTYPLNSTGDLLGGSVSADHFRDKIVLVGTALTANPSNFIFSPHSRKEKDTTMLEGAAQGLGTLLDDSPVWRSPPWVDLGISALLALGTANLALVLSPAQGLGLVLAGILAVAALSWLLFCATGLWLNLAHPIVVTTAAYYLVIPFRLVAEYRKRWHYQEKSELTVQLEQLKTNFLSLISHDLKTPIARIQGNAELVLSSGSISDGDRRSLESIVQQTTDMGEFVETILDVTRLETSDIPLQKATKDINAVVAEVVDSKQFLAREKNISLSTELEPIFAFKFDAKLIRRVLSNLVENAIKYSPQGTSITVRSSEEADWVKVSVADRGAGIPPEEQDRIFSKFYRCGNDETSRVKGSGLGLYLVKYFVELHKGLVELKSEIGRGSVFTISLPVT